MSSRPRVLFISPQPFFQWRGSSIRVKFNAIALEELGYEVDLLTLPIGEDDSAVKANVIRTWNLFGSKQISIGPSLLKLSFDFLLMIHGTALVIKNRYVVLHGTEETGFLCYLLSFISRGKCIYEKHSDSGSYSEGFLKRLIISIYNCFEHLTIKRCDQVICTGPGLADQARAVSSRARIATISDIPSSLVEPEPGQVTATRSQLAEDNEILVTYVGSFAEYQGVDIIFDAIPEVVAGNPAVKFCIIGGSDEEIARYSAQLDRGGAAAKVSFPGKVPPDSLPAWLAASDILLAPRKSGINSPLKILDYFKAGGAIVATNTVANQRLLDASCAVLCEFDSGAFAQAILTLAGDAERRNELSQSAYRLYRDQYNFLIFKELLGTTYSELLHPATK